MHAITRAVWDEKRQILYTGAKDKSIKIWRIPEEWNVYYTKQEEKKPAMAAAVAAPAAVEKKERAGSDDESDDDDLKGWAKK